MKSRRTFQFSTAHQILFGEGRILELPDLIKSLGERPFVITGSNPSRYDPHLKGFSSEVFSLLGEPSVDHVSEATAQAKAAKSDCVVGIGGGSPIDLAKSVAAMLANEGELFDYLEVIGKGQPLPQSAKPIIAIPTTAGTGAEVTKNAVLFSPEHQVKVSLRHVSMLPSIALVDPELTYEVSKSVTANTGLDALTQLIEVFLTKKASPMTDALVRQALPAGATALPIVFEDPCNPEARRDMAIASLFSGLGLANSGLGAVHGYAGPLGGMIPLPHGTACAILLPYCLEQNAIAAKDSGNEELLGRFEELAFMVTGRSGTADDVVQWAQTLSAELGIGKLSDHGFQKKHILELVPKAQRASSMKGNPVALSDMVLTEILEAAM